MHMCACMCACACVHAHACEHVRACVVECMYMRVNVHVRACACACGGGCLWVHVGVCVHVYPIIQVITKIYLLYFLCMAMYLYLQMIDNKKQNLNVNLFNINMKKLLIKKNYIMFNL